jgi:imidazolonepropionase-like amidohydrolase
MLKIRSKIYIIAVYILAGTDCHKKPSYIFNVKHRDFLYLKLKLLVKAGLLTINALHTAIILLVKYFNLLNRGTIKVSKRVDLILLRENPVKDIRVTRSIVRVWFARIEFQLSA